MTFFLKIFVKNLTNNNLLKLALYRKMEKNVGNFSEIFRSSNLNGQSFCLNSSSFDEETGNEIVQIIINNNGKCSFSMNEKTVLIINNSSSLNKIIREELLNNKIGKIYFYDKYKIFADRLNHDLNC